MTIDCRKSGPAKYRTKPDNDLEQFCYFYQNKKDRLFKKNFLAKRVDGNNNCLVFKIDSVINTTKNGKTKIYRATQQLKQLTNRSDGNDRGSYRQQIAEPSKLVDRKHFGGGKKLKKTLISSLTTTPVNQKSWRINTCCTTQEERLTNSKSYFHKEEIFLIMNRQKIDKKYFHLLKASRT